MCLANCNLGCSSTGCARTDIAQNELIILQFSEPIDPATVGPSSIRFRTPSGDQPVGEFLVNGNQVEFVPSLQTTGGQTFYGFATGETYTLTIPGGDTTVGVLRSTSGKPFGKTLSCTLRSNLGIVDINGVPPRGTLLVPSGPQLTSAPRTTDIIVEFNELIDSTPFLSGTLSPVTFAVRRNRAVPGGGFECDPNSEPEVLTGSQTVSFDAGAGKSLLTFRPSQPLPGNVCVEVGVTNGVTDLSGKPAQPQLFRFRTEVVPQEVRNVTEEFESSAQLDIDASAAEWVAGQAVFTPIGGDGRHGPFQLSLCQELPEPVDGKTVYVLNTDLTTIPEANTTTGAPIAVTDGRFFFTQMVLPSNARLTFAGSNPPIITVAGRLDIQGDVFASGGSVAALPAPPSGATATTPVPGQPGGAGGVFAGAGGRGGDRIVTGGTSGASAANQGQPGLDARLAGGHAYAGSTAGTGGRGSTVFPASGLNADMQFFQAIPPASQPTPSPVWACMSGSAAGGGGGFLVPGGIGRYVSNNHQSLTTGLAPRTDVIGPPTAGGGILQLLPVPTTTPATKSSLHFLVGGSGGGGSASSPCMSLFQAAARQWSVGAGGGGGGGTFALRAGASFRLAPTSRLFARGGNAAGSVSVSGSGPVPSPGGGGSGGSIVLQAGNQIEISASTIDVRGGLGGNVTRNAAGGVTPPNGGQVVFAGGNGADGFVRLEAPGTPSTVLLGAMLPTPTADNVASLSEVDGLVSFRSKFYSTNLIFGPEYSHYEIYATVDGVAQVFSDDPTVSTTAAGIGAPIRALFQCARLNLTTLEVESLRPWRTGVRTTPQVTGIASDARNGFRFALVVDRAFASTVTVQRVVIVYRV
jgi:hypothetical protein